MAAKGKKKGGKKLSKAEKEKLKQEEAERKAREEEQARRKAEEEAREREERERRETEERVRFEERERLRQQAEIEELNAIFADFQQKLRDYRQARKARVIWDRYMLCDGRPDPLSKQDINTFVTTSREEPTDDVRTELKKSEVILSIVDELKSHLKEIREDASDAAAGSYGESVDALLGTLFWKLDELTLTVLTSPGGSVDPDTMNIYACAKSRGVVFCVWGNSAKNPRVKSVDFPSLGFSMELPKQLALANLAVRVIGTNFDQFSQLSSSRQLKQSADKHEPSASLVKEDKSSAAGGGIKILGPDMSKGASSFKQTSPVASTAPATRMQMGARSAGSRKSPAFSEEPQAVGEGKDETGFDHVSSIGDTIRRLHSAATAEDKEEVVDPFVIDLRTFAPVGRILHVELLELPPQAKQVNSWMMQEVSPRLLRRFQLGKAPDTSRESRSVTGSVPARSVSYPKAGGSSIDMRPTTADVALKITLQCPKNVILFEPPRVALWNALEKNWKVKEVMDLKYDAEAKTVSFQTHVFGKYAVFQDLHLNMPFQSWEILPAGIDHCFLVIAAAYVEITIEIKGELCCLADCNEISQLKRLKQAFVPPSMLMESLRWSGVNLFPNVDGAKYVCVTKKNPDLVESLYKQLALSAGAFASCWSKWNSEADEEAVIVQAVECTGGTRPDEDQYRLYKATSRICSRLEMHESDETLSPQVAVGSQMHPDLYHMLMDGASETARQRCRGSSYLFVDCVTQLLVATNVLVYS